MTRRSLEPVDSREIFLQGKRLFEGKILFIRLVPYAFEYLMAISFDIEGTSFASSFAVVTVRQQGGVLGHLPRLLSAYSWQQCVGHSPATYVGMSNAL